MQLCFFEDEHVGNFHPLTLTRPADDLRVGILTMAEKWHHALDRCPWSRLSRPEAFGSVFEQGGLDHSVSTTWINSRYFPTAALLDEVRSLNEGTCIRSDDTVIAARVDGETHRRWMEQGAPDFNALLVLESPDFTALRQLWDLFQMNDAQIRADIERLQPAAQARGVAVSPHAVLDNEANIYLGEGAVIEPGAVLMAGDGPIYIGAGATVMAGSLIQGPTAVCRGATVKMGAKIYHGTTIGPVCKVGGEINNSIFHSYSNKGHDGFVGNSLIGQWVNLGADTNTSNLKNNYSTIRITDWESREEIETGQQFLGTVMGDHSKTAINTQLNTGTVCGVSCNIFAGDFPPKFIPSFSWVGSNVIQPYRIDKALEAMEAMMARRDVTPGDDYRRLMRTLFEQEHRGPGSR